MKETFKYIDCKDIQMKLNDVTCGFQMKLNRKHDTAKKYILIVIRKVHQSNAR